MTAVAASGTLFPYQGLLGFFTGVLSGSFGYSLITLVQALMRILCFAVLVTPSAQIRSLELRTQQPLKRSLG